MNVIGQEEECSSRVADSPGNRNLRELLNRFGSLELVIGLSTGEETLSLVHHVKSVTKGLLELNAVLLWGNHFSMLSDKEVLQWRRQFEIPFKSLRFKKPQDYLKYDRGLVPVEYLSNLLAENEIRALLTYAPWKDELSKVWDGEIVFISPDNRTSPVSRKKSADTGETRVFEGKTERSPLGAIKMEGNYHAR